MKSKPDHQSETALQIAIAGHLRKYLAPPAVFTAFPAGMFRGKDDPNNTRGKILWSMGLHAGFPDLLIMWGGPSCGGFLTDQALRSHLVGHGLYLLELKTIKGVLSDNQRNMHAAIRLTLPGAQIEVARTLEEAQGHFQRWGLPKREYGAAEGLAHGVGTKRIDEITITRRTPFNDPLPI